MRRLLVSGAVLLVLVVGATGAYGAVPRKLNFQGRLLDPSGTPKNGTFTITAKIFVGGVLCSTETDSVGVNSGLFNYQIGGDVDQAAGTISANCQFGAAAEVEIQVGTSPPLAPRIPLPAAAYAMAAQGVSGTGATVYFAGHGSGQIPFSDGNVNTGLNAEKWGGKTLANIRAIPMGICDYNQPIVNGSVDTNSRTRLTNAATCMIRNPGGTGCPLCPTQTCPAGCTFIQMGSQSTGSYCNNKPMNLCWAECDCPTTLVGYLRSQ